MTFGRHNLSLLENLAGANEPLPRR
jgi:hypothetical protein